MNLCCRLQRIFQRCGQELGVRYWLNEILGHFIDDTDELALGIPIVVLRRRLIGVSPSHTTVDLGLVSGRPKTGVGPFLDVTADLFVGFKVLLGQLQDLLLTQHVEIDLGHAQGRVLRLGDHRQALGLGGGIGPCHVAADIKAVKQHLAKADPGLLARHGVIDRL